MPSGTSSAVSDEIDLGELLRTLYRQKVIILLVTFLVTVVAAGYAFLATPYYQVQSLIRPVSQGTLDALNSTGVYELTPADALGRVAGSLSSYERRLAFFRDNQPLFAGLVPEGQAFEQAFERFNQDAFSMLQPDPKKTNNLSQYVGISLTYADGMDGAAVVNGFVEYVIEHERARIKDDLDVLVRNRLANLDSRMAAARASYQASKEAEIAALMEANSLKRAQVADELAALRREVKSRRENRIEMLDEAIQIAESLGISGPTTPSAMADQRGSDQVIRTEINSRDIPLYFMGAAALRAEREVLSERKNDDFTEPRIAELEAQLTLLENNRQVDVLRQRADSDEDIYLSTLASLREERSALESIAFNPDGMQIVRVDRLAQTPDDPIKPKRTLIIAIGLVLGGMLGLMTALFRHVLRGRVG
ncbi:LPS O-antigen chain length determinant protein, WzzB/FepE family [Pseudomonas cuatrocienegasensis]|uniref:LPS O-antigen chain length determinant protein, WzzB/FepE family n=1 Tax=Pseudomonas cuatrocienegasensis TaxID=543360 RepID=A0ABY1B9T1_9PSED|nr:MULTISPECIES: Wzz/FepE/Etk N-terminal domain-containing protein [Pseudomonas]OEC35329.1 chain-length determining protein [Pseudomonas sp. 21C1]SEQ32420.1 LPS O-antigen chain length determinant protein, WzzB/FepE family [Pseudomonas cuatrocienegasensis]